MTNAERMPGCLPSLRLSMNQLGEAICGSLK